MGRHKAGKLSLNPDEKTGGTSKPSEPSAMFKPGIEDGTDDTQTASFNSSNSFDKWLFNEHVPQKKMAGAQGGLQWRAQRALAQSDLGERAARLSEYVAFSAHWRGNRVPKVAYRPLHPAIGAEILDIDMSKPLDPDVVEELVMLWEEKSVVLFRGQKLSEDDQLRLTGYFGEAREAFFQNLPERKVNNTQSKVVLVSNVRVDGQPIGTAGDGELWFHSDHCYLPLSGRASILYAVEVPDEGGDTRFASGYAAYEALPVEIKEKLRGVMADFVHDRAVNGQTRLHTPSDDAPRAVHPAIVRHPGTGRPSLFINRLMTTRLLGMEPAESDALLERLFDLQESAQFTYDHKWLPGDLLVWDNRSSLHARTDFDPNKRRLMRRTQTSGEALEPA